MADGRHLLWLWALLGKLLFAGMKQLLHLGDCEIPVPWWCFESMEEQGSNFCI